MKALFFCQNNLQALLNGGGAELREASPEELRVLICTAAEGRADDASVAVIAELAGCSTARVKAALRYWQALHVLCTEEEAPAAVSEQTADPAKTADTTEVAADPAPKKPPLRPVSEGEGGTQEAADTIRDRRLAGFIDTCQATVGRVFNTRELTTLTSLLNDLPFSEEYLLTLIAYCKKKAKRFSFVYLEKTAYSMLERELLTTDDLNGYLAALDRFSSVEWKLRRLLGIGDRKLSAREQEYFMRWTGELGYGEDVIGIAYDITVDRLGKISLAYMNKLLLRFHEAGARDERAVNDLLDRERAEHAVSPVSQHTGAAKGKKEKAFATGASAEDPSATKGASFKREDFFAAALRRSYGDDGEEPSGNNNT